MNRPRTIRKVYKSEHVTEGAGVKLHRAFGFNEAPLFDPFLLLDDFRSTRPEEYLKGFPWHPHRGIETITYVLKGEVEHGDSMGNKGDIASGDVQWMTAGSGIIHQEMPKGDTDDMMEGFQLWANLPGSNKMMQPRYQDIKANQIPVITMKNGVMIKIICGQVGDIKGPVQDIIIEPEYLDITIPPHTDFSHPTSLKHTVITYIIDGSGYFSKDKAAFSHEIAQTNYAGTKKGPVLQNHDLALFNSGDNVTVQTKNQEVRFLLISGKPINEPVAWRGPIVMNTQEELQTAFEEYQRGTFIKNVKSSSLQKK